MENLYVVREYTSREGERKARWMYVLYAVKDGKRRMIGKSDYFSTPESIKKEMEKEKS